MTWQIVTDEQGRGPFRAGGSQRWAFRWAPYLIGGLIGLVGVTLLIWPFFAATQLFAGLIGAALIAAGLAPLLRRRPGARATGVLLIALGILAIVFSDFTVTVLIAFAGFSLVGLGIVWSVFALALGRGAFNVGMVPAFVLIVAGLIAMLWPSVALVVAAIALGLVLIAIAALLVSSGARLRRVRVLR